MTRSDFIDLDVKYVLPAKPELGLPVGAHEVVVVVNGAEHHLVLIELAAGALYCSHGADGLTRAQLSRSVLRVLNEYLSDESALGRPIGPVLRRSQMAAARALVSAVLDARSEAVRPAMLVEALIDPKAFERKYASELERSRWTP